MSGIRKQYFKAILSRDFGKQTTFYLGNRNGSTFIDRRPFYTLKKLTLLISYIAMPNHKIHHGRNVKGFREMLGVKQLDLASNLGDDWGPRKISILEQKESIHECLLEEIAKALKIPIEAFQEFS